MVSEKEDVALNLCPNGSQLQFSIHINGTTLTATKTALKVTIGDLSISMNFQNHSKLLPSQNMSAQTVLVVSGDNPLHVVMGAPRYVTANIMLGKQQPVNTTTVISYGKLFIYSSRVF